MHSEMSDRSIADHVGVSHFTIAKYRQKLKDQESTGRIFQSTTCKGRDGREYKLSNMKRTAARHREVRISPNAFKPIRQAIPMAPMKAISMPHDPVYGARALIAHFSHEYVEQLLIELRKQLDARAQASTETQPEGENHGTVK